MKNILSTYETRKDFLLLFFLIFFLSKITIFVWFLEVIFEMLKNHQNVRSRKLTCWMGFSGEWFPMNFSVPIYNL